jgi:hypothetical protein
MRITERLEYDAPAEAVFEMMSNPAYQERKCVESGAVRHSVTVLPQGAGTRVVVTRELPTDHLPDFAKSLVGPRLQTTETWNWGAPAADGSREGDLRVEVAGAPVALKASTRLAPSPHSSELTVNGDLKASIPLVGGKIEKAAAPAVVDALHSEGQTGRRWLTERG